jgi:hypothetical protein
MKVFKALTPVFDDLFKGVNKETPKLEKFANTIADKLVKNIPKWVATAKRELPPLIDKVKEFFSEATKFSDSAVKALGPEGLITVGIAAIGFKIGGLKGALAGALTKGFADVGFGPFESLILGSVSSAVLAGLAQGLASQAALAIIAAFKARMTAAATIPTPIPGGGTGAPPVVATGGGGGLLNNLLKLALPITILSLAVGRAQEILAETEAADAKFKADFLNNGLMPDWSGTVPPIIPTGGTTNINQEVQVNIDGDAIGTAVVEWSFQNAGPGGRRP